MDDFTISSLHESKNEWTSRLVNILCPLIVEGLHSIFEESLKLCKDNNETEKYLMTFQNFISRIPKWNPVIIETERRRICDRSGCHYLEELITCTHIIQLKLLTAIRAGTKQKKIDITIPKLDDFIHKAYIFVARKIYKNVYLFEISIPPLQIQKNQRELEILVQESILNAVRESIPIEAILRAYMDETLEEDVREEIKEEFIEDPKLKEDRDAKEIKEALQEPVVSTTSSSLSPVDTIAYEPASAKISFNDTDFLKHEDGRESEMNVPKDVTSLEAMLQQKRLESEEENDDDNMKIKITDQNVELGNLDIHVIPEPSLELLPDLLIDNIEILD